MDFSIWFIRNEPNVHILKTQSRFSSLAERVKLYLQKYYLGTYGELTAQSGPAKSGETVPNHTNLGCWFSPTPVQASQRRDSDM
jgi:hypothetical protein